MKQLSKCGMTLLLDGEEWLIAVDRENVGREQRWWEAPRPEAISAYVPCVTQMVLPDARGVVWFWRDVDVPVNPHPEGRYLLRFWDVNYLADVLVNGMHIGTHEGLQEAFVLEATTAIKPGAQNRIAVRVLHPTDQPIDGIVLKETAQGVGMLAPHCGIVDSVELLVTPAVRVEDLYVQADPWTGKVHVQVNIRNAGKSAAMGELAFAIATANEGEMIESTAVEHVLPMGDSKVDVMLKVNNPRLWDINDPYLYRVTARVAAQDSPSCDEASTRCGFREFKFENGYFRLNGRRIYLKSSHTATEDPIGLIAPRDPVYLRSEMVANKAMGYNMVRFIARGSSRLHLDIADEIGLLIYQEHTGAWFMVDSPKMPERFDRQVSAMVRRDRNHPSAVIWGMLNETATGPVFDQAKSELPLIRELDPTRVVLLGSGCFDHFPYGAHNGLTFWKTAEAQEPYVSFNPNPHAICAVPLWPAQKVVLHSGSQGEYSAARWTAPAAGEYAISSIFRGTGCFTKVDVHVLHNGKSRYDSFVNLFGHGDLEKYTAKLTLAQGDTLDFVVGWGGSYDYDGAVGSRWVDTTQVEATIQAVDGKTYDLAGDFSDSTNPNGPWSYGWLAAGTTPQANTFTAYAICHKENAPRNGRICNPNSVKWEDLLADYHCYPRVPHRLLEFERLRAFSADQLPTFFAEYGVGSGSHPPRILRNYEALGAGNHPLTKGPKDWLDAFMVDWEKLRLADVFASPEDFFDKCWAKMANLRKLGINALRSNPYFISYSLTGSHDPFMCSEGVISIFREHKPGTFDAMVDVFASLRWCLFAEPVSVYSGQKVKLEAVISNEDVLKPGEYPARLQVLDPNDRLVWEREVTVRIPEKTGEAEVPFALPVFCEEVPIAGPSGKYQFVAHLLKGGYAYGETIDFYVTNPKDLPAVKSKVTLWGKDPELVEKLAAMGIKTKSFTARKPTVPEVILVSAFPGGKGKEKDWRGLVERIAQGATAIFLCPDVFAKGDQPLGWLPLANKGKTAIISEYTFPQVYIRDEWAKRHPIFAGLPTGLMDYTFYREIIPDWRYVGQDTPDEAVAGAIRTSMGYGSEMMVMVYKLGAGRMVLNTLRIRQALGEDPTAEYLLRNMINYAAADNGKPLAGQPEDMEELFESLGY
jgi:hypothetical protein